MVTKKGKDNSIEVYDDNGNLTRIYIIHSSNRQIIEEQDYCLYEHKRDGTHLSLLDSRTIYLYSDGNINKILYTEEESNDVSLLYVDAKKIDYDYNKFTLIRFWRFETGIREYKLSEVYDRPRWTKLARKAFLEKQILVEKISSRKYHYIYRVAASIEYDSYYRGEKIYKKTKYIYDKQNPETLKKIIIYKVISQFSLLNKILVPVINFFIEVINMMLDSTSIEILKIILPLLKSKEETVITNDLPNELIKKSRSMFNWGQFPEFKEEFYVHGSLNRENMFYDIQERLDKILKENDSI